MHSRSASWVANQSKKPLRAAERTPLALKLMMRMGEEPGLGIGESKGRDLPVVIRAKAGMTPLHVRGGRVTQRITRAAKQWPGTRYHAGMLAKPHLHVPPVPPPRHPTVPDLRIGPR